MHDFRGCQIFSLFRRLILQTYVRRHGFLVLSDEAVFTYKVDNVYAPQSEASIRFDDETIGIEWPVATEQLLLSDKDGHAVSFKDAVYYE